MSIPPRQSVCPLAPIRSRRSAELAALRTSLAWPKRRHRDVIGPSVDVDLAMVAAGTAGNEQSTHAVLAHVPERHRADWFVIPGHISKLRTDRERNQGRCHDRPEPIYAADQFQPHQSVAASEELSGPAEPDGAGGFLPGVTTAIHHDRERPGVDTVTVGVNPNVCAKKRQKRVDIGCREHNL
jgi:hypothetical protein